MTVFNYDTGVTVDTAKLPPASIEALIARGVGHVFGNEAASKVVGSIRKVINPEAPSTVSTDAIKVWRDQHKDSEGNPIGPLAEMIKAAHVGFAEALAAGTLGTRESSAPRVDPLTRWMRQTAAAEIVAILKQKGAIAASERKHPALADPFQLGGQTVTFGDLIDRRLANPKEGPRLAREGKAHLDALARQKARVEANAKSAAEAETLEEMGLA